MARSTYDRRVHQVMDYVRANLCEELSLEQLAKVAYFSPFHFHRIFKAATGETLTRFIQRARLERAAYLMKSAPMRELGSIALEVGFSEQSDFSRVFKRHYGMPPSQWDRRSRPKPNGIDEFEEAVRQARALGPEPEATLVSYPALRMAYVRTRTPFIGAPLRNGYHRLTHWLGERGVDWQGAELIGLSWDHYETTPIDQVSFDFGFGVPPDIAGEGEFGIHEFPKMKAVRVHCQGPLIRIAVAWEYLYNEWLPSSPFQPGPFPGIKRFRKRPDELGWNEWDLDCVVPLEDISP